MSLKRTMLFLSAGALLFSSVPSFAQAPDPTLEQGAPGESIPGEPIPAEPEPIDSELTPESSVDSEPSSNFGGTTGPTGPLSLVQCGPGGAAFVVTKVSVGCRVLEVNSPPGQVENAETP